LFLYRGGDERGQRPDSDQLVQDRDESETGQRRALLCRACQAPITTSVERLEKQGKHLHTFFNPAGIVYEIGCFRRAPGCHAYGVPSSEFAWFPGYSWQVVYCRSCQQHLGWKFIADDGFFGLVVNQLIEN
jgi:hypothetical protein